MTTHSSVTTLEQAVDGGTYAGKNAGPGRARGDHVTFHDSVGKVFTSPKRPTNPHSHASV